MLNPQTIISGETVNSLRQRIDRIDRQIIDLLKAREDVAGQIADYKNTHRLPSDYTIWEKNLINKMRSYGERAGLDPDFIEKLFGVIICGARKTFSCRVDNRTIRKGAKVLIIGGSGAMGKYFAAYFIDAGYKVDSIDKHDWHLAPELCSKADLAILSVPIRTTEAVASQIGPMLSASCLLVDITSIKVRPMSAMLCAHKGAVMGLHPLFGPDTSSLKRKIIVATDGRYPEKCQWLIDQLAAWGAVLVWTTPEEHDAVMDVVQALRHFTTFAIGQFFYQKGVNLNRILEFASPLFRLELGMVGRLFAQKPSLFSEIIFASDDRQQLLREYLSSLQANIKMLESADKELFEKRFRQIAKWFSPFSRQAMRESTYLIGKLTERF